MHATDLAGAWIEPAAELGGERRAGERTVVELRRRFDPGTREIRGVHLLTYHRAKGLEFDAVFLPRLDEKELPSKLAHTDDEVEEERRLLYVGITRARHSLALSWSKRPSPFLAELRGGRAPAAPAPPRAEVSAADPELYEALASWRRERAKSDEIPAYIVFHNRTLVAIADARPRSLQELARIPGVGTAKLDRYGEDVLRVVSAC